MSAIPQSAERLDEGEVATTRDVYSTGEGTVIKVEHDDLRTEPNKDEVELWEALQDPTLLAPIVDYADDYSWVEMVECRRLDRLHDKSLKDAFKQKVVESLDFPIYDLHVGNIGILPSNREIVCIDYAAHEYP